MITSSQKDDPDDTGARSQEQELSRLLQQALAHTRISLTLGGEGISFNLYKHLVQRSREIYHPDLRSLVSCYRIAVENNELRTRMLELIRTELQQFIKDDRIYTVNLALGGSLWGDGFHIEVILQSLIKLTIMTGSDEAAASFYRHARCARVAFRRYYLLRGIVIQKEMEIFDGVALVPLPSSISVSVNPPEYKTNLPPCLPNKFALLGSFIGIDIADFLPAALIRVDKSVSPAFLNPEKFSKSNLHPSKHFNEFLSSADIGEFHVRRFCQSLALVRGCPVECRAEWNRLDDAYPFDLTGDSYFPHDPSDFSAECLELSEDQVQQAVKLYGGMASLSSEVVESLQTPLNYWMLSKSSKRLEDKIINLAVAMESFYLHGEERPFGEITFKLRLRSALYLGKKIEDKENIRRLMSKFYSQRSGILHEGKLATTIKTPGGVVPVKELVLNTQDLFGSALQKAVRGGGLPDWHNLELVGGDID